MAANRFATMLHRNTNKITLILIYAVLEWILIVLLLLNSLFSFLILKFAEFFGLRPPCLWCTRIDHVFDSSRKGKNLVRDHLCEAHAKEVSRLGFCLSHQKLVESQSFCGDCLPPLGLGFEGFSRNGAFFSAAKGDSEVELNSKCSCCRVSLDCNKYASCVFVTAPSWDVLECAKKENLVLTEELEDKKENQMEAAEKGCDSESEGKIGDGLEAEEEKGTLMEEILDLMKDKSVQVCIEEKEEDASCVETTPEHLEFCLDFSGNTLVPIESVDDSVMVEDVVISREDAKVEDDDDDGGKSKGQEVCPYRVESKQDTFIDVDINVEPQCFMEIEEDENSLVFHPKMGNLAANEFDSFGCFPLVRWASEEACRMQEMVDASRERRSDAHSDTVASEEPPRESIENEADVSIGTEIPDLDITDEVQIQESLLSDECDDRGLKQEEMLELHHTKEQPSFHHEPNDVEEEKVPETPTSVDSLNQLHKKLLMLEQRDSMTEDSMDGSVTSELEGRDGVVTVEHLKSALRAERKALQVLYAELEEERSASAVATNQTMAMINRLQEEKAAMQMEALQYQRMMEEQAEYDQEALQLLNELMVKREKEKEALERELEGYRKKLLEYEAKEKMRMSKRGSQSGFSPTAACSEDGQSVDLNRDVKGDEGFFSHTPVGAVVDLEESLADFEEERMSILEQLKVLEEKLLTLDDDDDDDHDDDHDDRNGQHFEDVRELENINGNHVQANGLGNGFANGIKMNGKHLEYQLQKGRLAVHKGKSLLPLFDAISDENGVTALINGNVVHDSCSPMFETESKKLAIEEESKKLAIEEEVDHLYERLQALEADREFLKHSISSLKKGDKGMDLLQEILQHLRDLRSVELRVRSLGNSVVP